MVSDSAVLVGATGAMDGKPERLRQLAAPPAATTATVERAYVTGDVGVTIGTLDRAAGTGRASSPARQRFARTWVYRAAQWRLLSELVAPAERLEAER